MRPTQPFRDEHRDLVEHIEHLAEAARQIPQLTNDERAELRDRVLAFLRGTLTAGARLAAGETVEQTAVRPPSDDAPGTRLRWFARDGWEPAAAGALATGPLAVVIVPARPARAVELLLALEPPLPELRASIGGRPLASEWTPAGWRLLVPRDALLRGDNAVALTRPPGGPPLELRRLRLVPAP